MPELQKLFKEEDLVLAQMSLDWDDYDKEVSDAKRVPKDVLKLLAEAKAIVERDRTVGSCLTKRRYEGVVGPIEKVNRKGDDLPLDPFYRIHAQAPRRG